MFRFSHGLMRSGPLVAAAALLLVLAVPPGRAVPIDPPKNDTAEKVRKALDQPITVDFSGQSLTDAVEHLRKESKLNIVLDRFTLQTYGLAPESIQINLKLQNVKLRTVLKQLLSQANLAYVIDGEIMLLTTDDMATQRQVRQRVTIDLAKTPLDKALKDLAKETNVNIVLDPRHLEKGKADVTLQLDDVPLEVAVRLISEMAGLRSVKQSNVLFVTTKEVAAELKKEEAPDAFTNPYYPFFPGGGVIFGREIGFGGGVMPVPPIPIAIPDVAVPVPPAPPPEKPVQKEEPKKETPERP